MPVSPAPSIMQRGQRRHRAAGFPTARQPNRCLWDGTEAPTPKASLALQLLLGSAPAVTRPTQPSAHCKAALGRRPPALLSCLPVPCRHPPFPTMGCHAPIPCPHPGTPEQQPELPAALVQLDAAAAEMALQSWGFCLCRAQAVMHPHSDGARMRQPFGFALSDLQRAAPGWQNTHKQLLWEGQGMLQGHGHRSSGSALEGFPKLLPEQREPHPGCTRDELRRPPQPPSPCRSEPATGARGVQDAAGKRFNLNHALILGVGFFLLIA